MDAPDIGKFRQMFPTLSGNREYSDDVLALWWDAAGEYIAPGRTISGEKYRLARLLMTAHLMHGLLNSANGTGGQGAVQSASEGSVSVSFTAPNTRNGWEFWLSTSPYGIQLWAMLKQAAAGGSYFGGLPEREAVRKVGGVWY